VGPDGVDTKRSELQSLTQRSASIAAELGRAKEARTLIDGYVKACLMPPAVTTGGRAPPPKEDVVELLAFRAEKCAVADADVLRLEVELESSKAAVEAATAALAKLEAAGSKKSTKTSRDVSVLLQLDEAAAKSGDPCVLLLTYMVQGASWSPSYDIRVETASAKSGGELSLSYFGLVVNGSGEGWEGCRLSLSTAQPSKAGMPPAPPRRMLRWQQQKALLGHRGMNSWGGGGGTVHNLTHGQRRRSAAVPIQACMSSNMMLQRSPSCDALELESLGLGGMLDGDDESDAGAEPAVATSTVAEGGGGTASFLIERPVSIEADCKPHKVTIALLAFEPELLYFATPSLEQAFYLQVKAKNSSNFPLLASRKVAVFLDGSFVTTTSLKDVSPTEEFTTFLGADSSLKLVHQQLARERKTAGTFSKTQSTSHRFVTKVHNTKPVAARLTVVEVLPKSTEEKIKVELLSPAAKELRDEGTAGDCVMQNKVTNNVVWQLTLPAGAKKDLSFEYTVTWPSDKELGSYDYQG